MEEDAFSTSLSSLSSLSSQSNYQTLTSNSANNTSSSRNSTFSSNQSNSPTSSSQESAGPFAVFLFRSNSGIESFDERKISLDKPCKIGRSVAKIKPEPNNAIFDCKVLSRNHALLWHENSKFFIQDTKSSNGTFLNGNRLGKSNEDSAPFELTSGDIIQFGVDVTENTKKVTHGCITVEIKLYHKPGVEATNKPTQTTQSNKIDVQTQELYQLALYLQEAMMREEILNQKLISLQTFVDQAKETSENGWLTLIDEDRLLSRIDFLEKQSNLYSKNHSEDSLKKCINNLRTEKFTIENTAKLTIQKIIEEKAEISQKYDELNTAHTLRLEEFSQLQKLVEESKANLIDLATKYQELLNEAGELQQNLLEQKANCIVSERNLELEKEKCEILLDTEKTLNTKIESLIAEKDFATKRLDGILAKIEKNNIVFDNTNELNGEKLNKTKVIYNDSANNMLEGSYEENLPDAKNELNPPAEIKTEKEVPDNLEPDQIDEIFEKIEDSDKNQMPSLSQSPIATKDNLLQQELDEQKLLNNNLLQEIAKLNDIINSRQKVGTEPQEKTESEIENQRNSINEDKEGDDVIPNPDVPVQNYELIDLKKEFTFIKSKMLLIEAETKELINTRSASNDSNESLVKYFNYLEESFKRVQELQSSIDLKESTNESNLTDAQKECEQNLNKFLKLQDEFAELEKECLSYKKQLVIGDNVVEKMANDFDNLSLQIKIVSYISAFPLLVLVIAVMVALYPILATITATTS